MPKKNEPVIKQAQVDALSDEQKSAYRKKCFMPLILQVVTLILGLAIAITMLITPSLSFQTVIVDSKTKEDKLYTITYSIPAIDIMSTFGSSLEDDEEFSDLFMVNESGVSSKSVEDTVAYLRDANISSYMVVGLADTVVLRAIDHLEDSILGNYSCLKIAELASALGDDSGYEEIDTELVNFGKFADYFVNEIGHLNIEGLELFAYSYADYYYGTFYDSFKSYAKEEEDGYITYDYSAIKASITQSQLSTLEKWFTENASMYLTQEYEFSFDLFADMDVCVGYVENSMVVMDVNDILYAVNASGNKVSNYENIDKTQSYTISYGITGTSAIGLLGIFGCLAVFALAFFGLLFCVIAAILMILRIIRKSPVNKSNTLAGGYGCSVAAVIFAYVFNIMAFASFIDTEVVCAVGSSAIFASGAVVGLILGIIAIVVSTVSNSMIKKNNAKFFSETSKEAN